MFKPILISAVIAGALSVPGTADAFCASRDEIVQQLAAVYDIPEASRELMSGETTVAERWTSAGSGQSVFVLTNPDGQSCIMAQDSSDSAALPLSEGG